MYSGLSLILGIYNNIGLKSHDFSIGRPREVLGGVGVGVRVSLQIHPTPLLTNRTPISTTTAQKPKIFL